MTVSRDCDIVAQELAARCEFIATSNRRSISHEKLNALVRREFGRNDDFIGEADIIADRLLSPTDFDEVPIIAAMSVAGRPAR